MLKSVTIVMGILALGQVASMALKGPVVTTYTPCGLGVVYFEKVTDILWKGVINLGIYPHLPTAHIKIDFKKSITLYTVTQLSCINRTNESRNFTLTPLGSVPSVYSIFFTINGNVEDIPTVARFALNDINLCDEQNKENDKLDSMILDNGKNHVCGRRSMEHTEITSVRTEARAGDWPWHVAIEIRRRIHPKKNAYHCGGNIISDTVILTAGHCVFYKDKRIETHKIIVVAGVSNLADKLEIGRQERNVEKVILHANYDKKQSTFDLALLVVNKLRFTVYVRPICIWGPHYDKTYLFYNQAVVNGFGMTENDELSKTLRSSNTIAQKDETCIALSPKTYSNLLNEFTICAGEGPNSETNPRAGDSGGGLVYARTSTDNKLTWYLRGILSKCVVPAGEKWCDPNYYVIYTDVAPHYTWLLHHMMDT